MVTAALRAVVVEDEPLARQTLQQLVEDVPWLRCVGEAGDGRTAVSRIDSLEPDIVFLDVQMPELSGVEVLAQIACKPAIVFTTAYDHYAINAFELGAIDYLLKPFGPERFRVTLQRIRDRLSTTSAEAVRHRWSQVQTEGPMQRMFARRGSTIVPVVINEVIRFEASDDYVTVHIPNRASLLIALPLAELERRLDPGRFLRVHRAHIVNLDCIRSMEPFDDRRLQITLTDGSHLVASRTGSQVLRKQLF